MFEKVYSSTQSDKESITKGAAERKKIGKESGIQDNRIQVETGLLKAGIESNSGPVNEVTTKLPRYTKWTRELAEWVIPYVTKCELNLTNRTQLLFSFLDPNSPGTSYIFPVVCKLLEVDTSFLKDNYLRGALRPQYKLI